MSDTSDVIVAFRSPARRKGFAQIPNVVLLDKSLSDAAIRLYGLLVSYAMQTGSFRASQAVMGEDLGKGERTARTLLKELSRRGLITVHRQGVMLPNIYFVEDAYALYDTEVPRPKQLRRAESDRKKIAGHCGKNQPVIAEENCRHLNTLSTKNKKKESDSFASLFQARKEQETPCRKLTTKQLTGIRTAAREQAKFDARYRGMDEDVRYQELIKEAEVEF